MLESLDVNLKTYFVDALKTISFPKSTEPPDLCPEEIKSLTITVPSAVVVTSVDMLFDDPVLSITPELVELSLFLL